MRIFLSIFTIISCSLGLSFGQQVDLPTIYYGGAVLKQNSEITLRGWARPTAKVCVVASWNTKDTVVVITKNTGKFEFKLKTPNGSFDKHTITFNGQPLMQDVLIGEVWLCSGQSNMEWSVNHGIIDGQKHASEANDQYMRILKVPLRTAECAQENVFAQWEYVTPESMRIASSIGYFFGRELRSKLNIPIGIIVAAWGGASVESFTPADVILSDTLLSNHVQDQSNAWKDDRMSKMYNAMINPLSGFPISGVLWYQGESNVPSYKYYQPMLSAMIYSWRDDFGDVPFYLAQIAPFNYSGNKNLEAAYLRQSQEMVAKNVENCEFVVLSDLTDNVNDIHPMNKLTPALRFANIALTKVYGKESLPHKYPTLQSCVNNGKKTVITFDNLVGVLQIGKDVSKRSTQIVGLVVVDSKGSLHSAQGKIIGRILEVTAKGVQDIVEVRYMFDDTTIGNLFSSECLPVAPFSTKR